MSEKNAANLTCSTMLSSSTLQRLKQIINHIIPGSNDNVPASFEIINCNNEISCDKQEENSDNFHVKEDEFNNKDNDEDNTIIYVQEPNDYKLLYNEIKTLNYQTENEAHEHSDKNNNEIIGKRKNNNKFQPTLLPLFIHNNNSKPLERDELINETISKILKEEELNSNKIINNKHFFQKVSSSDAAEDELDILVRRAEQMRIQEELSEKGILKAESGQVYEKVKYTPHLIVPTFVEESIRAGNERRERRKKRVKILYDVQTTRAQTPSFLDVSQDDPKTPLAFRYIRIILTTAEARKAQDIHLDQYSSQCMSVAYATQLGVTGKLIIRGAIVQSIIYYIAFYDLLSAGKGMPGPVRDYSLKIKVRSHDFLQGTFNVYRVNCIRTNHELGFYHIVMRTLQN